MNACYTSLNGPVLDAATNPPLIIIQRELDKALTSFKQITKSFFLPWGGWNVCKHLWIPLKASWKEMSTLRAVIDHVSPEIHDKRNQDKVTTAGTQCPEHFPACLSKRWWEDDAVSTIWKGLDSCSKDATAIRQKSWTYLRASSSLQKNILPNHISWRHYLSCNSVLLSSN